MEEVKEESGKEKVREVPIFITEDDIKKMIYLTYLRIGQIEIKLDELNKLAKQDGIIQ